MVVEIDVDLVEVSFDDCGKLWFSSVNKKLAKNKRKKGCKNNGK